VKWKHDFPKDKTERGITIEFNLQHRKLDSSIRSKLDSGSNVNDWIQLFSRLSSAKQDFSITRTDRGMQIALSRHLKKQDSAITPTFDSDSKTIAESKALKDHRAKTATERGTQTRPSSFAFPQNSRNFSAHPSSTNRHRRKPLPTQLSHDPPRSRKSPSRPKTAKWHSRNRRIDSAQAISRLPAAERVRKGAIGGQGGSVTFRGHFSELSDHTRPLVGHFSFFSL